jgi:uncharacterized protein (TIGR03089 family)
MRLDRRMTDLSVVDLFRREFARDGARPFLTWYGADAARIELSVATLERWIAKTANFLQDGLAAAPGDRAVVALPDHWLTPAVWWGCWANGVVVEPIAPGADLPVDADILFVTPERAGEAAALARDVIAVSVAPLGGRVRGELSGGVADFGADVPGYDDRFSPYSPVDPHADALVTPDGPLSFAGIVGAAVSHYPFPDEARVLTGLPLSTPSGLLVVVAALHAHGGIVTGTTDPSAVAAEKVTLTVGTTALTLPRHDKENV